MRNKKYLSQVQYNSWHESIFLGTTNLVVLLIISFYIIVPNNPVASRRNYRVMENLFKFSVVTKHKKNIDLIDSWVWLPSRKMSDFSALLDYVCNIIENTVSCLIFMKCIVIRTAVISAVPYWKNREKFFNDWYGYYLNK